MFTTVNKDTLKFEIVGGNKIKLDETVDSIIDLVDEMLPEPQMNNSRQKRQEDGTYKYVPAESVKDMGYNQAIKDIRQKLRR